MKDDGLDIPAFLRRSDAERIAMDKKHASERATGADINPVFRSGLSSPKRRRRRGGPHSEQDPRNDTGTATAAL